MARRRKRCFRRRNPSPDGRLVLRNETYVKMYGLAPEIVRAGSSLRGLIDHRIKVGSFSGNPDQYVADLLSSIAKGKIINSVREHNGRYIAIVNHPMENGGWVATHEDVTALRQADLQRISMEGQIARRAMLEAAILAFRERIESVLKIVSDGAGKMQSAAVGLLGTSEKTTEHTRSAIRASDRASENVETAASAATELSASIAEIVAQLTRTTEVVRAVGNGAVEDGLRRARACRDTERVPKYFGCRPRRSRRSRSGAAAWCSRRAWRRRRPVRRPDRPRRPWCRPRRAA